MSKLPKDVILFSEIPKDAISIAVNDNLQKIRNIKKKLHPFLNLQIAVMLNHGFNENRPRYTLWVKYYHTVKFSR